MTDNKKTLIKEEILDMLAGTAFPVIAQVLFSVTIVVFADYTDFWIGLIGLIVGELFVLAAYYAFGTKSGQEAYSKTVLADKMRADGQPDYKKGGEYAPYKGFLIGFISTIPYLIMHIFYCIFPNASFLEFILLYACGWAIYPIRIGTGTISALSMLFVLVPTVEHGICYIIGKNKEFKRREVLRLADEANAAEFEQRQRAREEQARRQREQALKENSKKKKK